MPYIRRRRPAKKAMKKRAYRKRVPRLGGLATRGYRTFTETVDAGTLLGNTGGVFYASINSLPQVAQYQNLYQEFTIKKFQVMLIPKWDGQDENSQLFNASATLPWVGAPRIAFAVNESATITNPINELDVLQCNGAKIRALKSITNLYCNRAVPLTSQLTQSGLFAAMHTKSSLWLDFDAAGALSTPFAGIKYWITQETGPSPSVTVPVQAYFKITFCVRDPR